MKYQVKTVRGAQAEMVQKLGLVKISESSAEDLFNFGVPLVIVGNNVNDYHFFGGWHLAMHVDSQRYLSEGVPFSVMRNRWSSYNENPETGKIAYFVDKQYVADTSRSKLRRRG